MFTSEACTPESKLLIFAISVCSVSVEEMLTVLVVAVDHLRRLTVDRGRRDRPERCRSWAVVVLPAMTCSVPLPWAVSTSSIPSPVELISACDADVSWR